MQKPKHSRLKRIVEFMILDAFMIVTTYGVAMGLYFLIDIHVAIMDVLRVLPFIIAFKLASFLFAGLYHIYIDYIGFDDVFKIALVSIITNAVLFFVFLFAPIPFLHPMTLVFIAPLEIALIAAPRTVKKMGRFLDQSLTKQSASGTRVLVVGAGDGGEMVIKDMLRNTRDKTPVAVVDDNDAIIGSRLLGVPVNGPIDEIHSLIDYYDVHEVVIAIADMRLKRLQTLVETIAQKNVRIKRLPLMSEITEGLKPRVMDVKVEDLLNRDEINLDHAAINAFIEGKTILITGGGGSIGSELCRQIARKGPQKLVIFDLYENGAYDIQTELMRRMKTFDTPVEVDVLIGSVADEARIRDVVASIRPDVMFHAAAYKHVPLMERSPKEAMRTNIIGTRHTAKAASDYAVEDFILVSSDKAVRPTNIMGATKRYGELIIQEFSAKSATRFSAVRFGNVLDSNGSVIPLFRRQIEEGGPVSVTHPKITRFFMTIPEAVGLILQSAVFASGGEIFVLDMGEPIKIKDLAEKMIKLAGYTPGADVDIEYIGLRPGEKLYEETLVKDTHAIKQTNNDKIYVETTNTNTDHIDIAQFIRAFETSGEHAMIEHLKNSIISYHTPTEQ